MQLDELARQCDVSRATLRSWLTRGLLRGLACIEGSRETLAIDAESWTCLRALAAARQTLQVRRDVGEDLLRKVRRALGEADEHDHHLYLAFEERREPHGVRRGIRLVSAAPDPARREHPRGCLDLTMIRDEFRRALSMPDPLSVTS